MNEHRISLDLSKEPLVAPVLYLGQGDKLGTTLIVSIYDDGQVPTFESGSTVTLCMKNPGENGGYYEVAGTLEGNEATFLIDEEYAASTSGVSDIAYVEVSTIFNTTSTSRFTYVVFPSAEHGADPSSTYSNGINEAIERAIDAAEAAEGVVLQDVPLMSPTVRGGAQLGDGLEITDGVLSVDPETIDLPVATTSDAGVVIADGSTITVDSDGTIHGANTYTLPPATTSTLGGVIPDGSTITVDSDGTIHGSSSYALPTMGTTTKGGAKLGSGLSVSNDTLSANVTGIKGNAENSYRTGNVNLTPANIGAATQTDMTAIQAAVGNVDVPTQGSLQSQIDSVRESVSHVYVSTDGRTVQFQGTDIAFRFGVSSSNDYVYVNVRIGDTWLGQKIIANWS